MFRISYMDCDSLWRAPAPAGSCMKIHSSKNSTQKNTACEVGLCWDGKQTWKHLDPMNIQHRISWEFPCLFSLVWNSSITWGFFLRAWVSKSMLNFLATPGTFRVSMFFLGFFFDPHPPCMTNPKFPRNLNGTDVYVKSVV